MEKLDVERLGVVITEYRDGRPFTSMVNPTLAAKQIAEKVNEIIDSLQNPAPKQEKYD